MESTQRLSCKHLQREAVLYVLSHIDWIRFRVVLALGAGGVPALPDLLARLRQHRLVGGILPLHQLLDQPEAPLALCLLRFLGREELRMARRVVHYLCEDYRPRRCQWAARPPQVERARVPMTDGFLPGRSLVDGLLYCLGHWSLYEF